MQGLTTSFTKQMPEALALRAWCRPPSRCTASLAAPEHSAAAACSEPPAVSAACSYSLQAGGQHAK